MHTPVYFKYLIIYLCVLSFALIIKGVQKNQLKKKYENEKKISELQLALIRNQLDPHFTFNSINSILYSVNNADKEQASKQLLGFANLFRNLLLSAGSTRRSLGEEIDFCNDYLMLEKMRFEEKFNFSINVSEDVDRLILVPKMLIQIHAENSVKHGLSALATGGMLTIEIRKVDNYLLIEIADNGIGRKEAGTRTKTSTGKGLELMDELYSIYKKHYNVIIESEIIDLYDMNNNSSGTKIMIRIANHNEYERN